MKKSPAKRTATPTIRTDTLRWYAFILIAKKNADNVRTYVGDEFLRHFKIDYSMIDKAAQLVINATKQDADLSAVLDWCVDGAPTEKIKIEGKGGRNEFLSHNVEKKSYKKIAEENGVPREAIRKACKRYEFSLRKLLEAARYVEKDGQRIESFIASHFVGGGKINLSAPLTPNRKYPCGRLLSLQFAARCFYGHSGRIDSLIG